MSERRLNIACCQSHSSNYFLGAFEEVSNEWTERIPSPANGNFDVIRRVRERPEDHTARRSEFRASGKDRETFAGQHETYCRMHGFNPADDRHADLVPPLQGRHSGRDRFFARSGWGNKRTPLQLAHRHGGQGERRTDWNSEHQGLRSDLGHLNLGTVNCRPRRSSEADGGPLEYRNQMGWSKMGIRRPISMSGILTVNLLPG